MPPARWWSGVSDGVSQATRIVAVRHGETAWNAVSRMQGHQDIALNDVGRAQAQCVAAALRDEGIDAIYASDLQRAFETAQAISQVIGAPIVADPGLRERAFGEFETLTHADIEAHWPEAARLWRERDPDFAPAGGESLRDFHARCIGAVARWAAAHAGQTIAIVAHGGVMDCLYRAATRIDLQAPRSWALGNASINRLLYSPEGFTLVGWSDTRHLDEAARDESSDGKISPGT